jgi:hypothetical protein
MAECGINVLAQEGNRALVRVTCRSCNDENLLQIIFQTEVEASETLPARADLDEGGTPTAAPISGDELLELHEILAGHAGPLTELLARR